MSQLLDSGLDEERLRECQAYDARMRSTRHPAATCLDDAEACLRAARQAYAENALLSTAIYIHIAVHNLHNAVAALRS